MAQLEFINFTLKASLSVTIRGMNPPHGRPFYWTFAIVGLFLLCNMAWDTVSPDGQPAWARLLSAVIGAAFLLLFVQAVERLFRPENALARTRALSDRARQELGRTRRIFSTLFGAGMLATFAVRLIGGKDHKDLSSDLWYLALAFNCVAGCLADICGESNPLPDSRVDFVTRGL
jgi:hypothetical protein